MHETYGNGIAGAAAANPGMALIVVLVLVSLVSCWLLYEHIILGVCDCSCGPGTCGCGCGCRRGCPCASRDKSALGESLRNRSIDYGNF